MEPAKGVQDTDVRETITEEAVFLPANQQVETLPNFQAPWKFSAHGILEVEDQGCQPGVTAEHAPP